MTNSLLWKIEKDNLPQSFLFGTIHVYDSNVFRIPDILYELIDSADIYLPESDNRQMSYANMLNCITVNGQDYSLKNYFSGESYAKILSLSNIDADILDRYKPFFVSSLILTAEDMPGDSVDYELLSHASLSGKDVRELESFEEQINAIDNIPYREQAEIVENTLLSSNRKSDFNKLMNSYKEQDLQALKENLREMNPSGIFIDSLQKNRNTVMSNKIDSLLGTGYSLFVAVGALHLVDTEDVKGIISFLEDRGYSVEAINFSFTV
ncbi:MAG: TraB/GumN family protein [Prevotellaceae bacterium]|jgi:uncharacterized protein YbaP (TraB family)|nr:TraB/GumN family protein [Prevotellaceae bacterium]